MTILVTKMADSLSNVLKTLWEKEILLVWSVFKRLVLQTRKNQGPVWERVNIISPLDQRVRYSTEIIVVTGLNSTCGNVITRIDDIGTGIISLL